MGISSLKKASSKNRSLIRTRTLELIKIDPLKSGPVGKTGPQGLKALPFFSSHMKDNFEVIHFHIKSRDAQDLVLVQITFGKCTTNFDFENGKVGIKTTIANLQTLLACNVSACLRIFMQLRFQ